MRNLLKHTPILYAIIVLWTTVNLNGRQVDTMNTEAVSTSQIQQAMHTLRKAQEIDSTMRAIFPSGGISFADSVIIYDPGALGEGTGDEPSPIFQKPERALGIPDGLIDPDSSFVSLGKGGTLVLKFTDNVLIDGPGPDLYIFEANSDPEDTYVWISEDGKIFIPVGRVSQGNPAIDIQPVVKPGTFYPYIKLRDDPDQGSQEGPSLGADIDAVGAINTAVLIHLPVDQIFTAGSIQLNSDAPAILSRVAQQIRQVPNAHITIQVFSDNLGMEEFNLIQTLQQAGAIRNYLMDRERFLEIDFSIRGWGERRSIASNESEEGRRRNRRIEFLVHPKYERTPTRY